MNFLLVLMNFNFFSPLARNHKYKLATDIISNQIGELLMTTETKQPKSSEMQGEGDRKSAKKYNQDTREFVESGKVAEASKKAGKQDPKEAKRSEKIGRERAKEVDPEVHREYEKAQK